MPDLLRSPEGESWVICARCGSNSWLLTKVKANNEPGRAICTACKNELLIVPTTANRTTV
jgi:transcription elongation factor Elf1